MAKILTPLYLVDLFYQKQHTIPLCCQLHTCCQPWCCQQATVAISSQQWPLAHYKEVVTNFCFTPVIAGTYLVPLAVLHHRILCGQRHAAHDDDNHDERVEEGEGDDAVDKDADAVVGRELDWN